MEDNLVVLFCIVDEFCKEFYPEYEKTLIAQGIKRRSRPLVNLLKSVLVPLCVFVQSLSGEKTGIYFIDSTMLQMRKN